MGLIALICLSLWQPTVLSDGFSLRGGRPIAAVIVLDTSPSMGYVLAGDRSGLTEARQRMLKLLDEPAQGPWTCLDEARGRALEMLEDLPAGSKVAILETADRRRPGLDRRPGRRPAAHPRHQEAAGQQPAGDAGPGNRLLPVRPRRRRAGAGPGAVPAPAGRVLRPDRRRRGTWPGAPNCSRAATGCRPRASTTSTWTSGWTSRSTRPSPPWTSSRRSSPRASRPS